MFVFALLCRTEMSRRPREVYAVPVLVRHGFGASAVAAWLSLVVTLISSFACIASPLQGRCGTLERSLTRLFRRYIRFYTVNANVHASLASSRNTSFALFVCHILICWTTFG